MAISVCDNDDVVCSPRFRIRRDNQAMPLLKVG
jgi:hypothetical protein